MNQAILSIKPTATAQQNTDFVTFSQTVISILQADINTLLSYADLPSPLNNACDYAMTGKGKRVRPLLVASAFQTVSSQQLTEASPANLSITDNCRRAMLAVELLHTYSLVHDDLPCMDDDELRRGRATCHIKFDEATALLTGDVLQNLAFEILAADIDDLAPIPATQSAKLLHVLSARSRRMVVGQMLDLNAENSHIDQAELERIHRDKTGALIEAAVLMGGICANANTEQLQVLSHFASTIGLAFQVQDDILDVTSTTDMLGKPSGSDEGLDKSTYVKLMGVAAADAYAEQLFTEATSTLNQTFNKDTSLNALADWIWHRES